MRLRDKIAIVTGAGSGFGEAIARRYAEEGAKVIVNDVDPASAKRVAGSIVQEGGKAAAQQGDVTQSAQVKAMVQCALDQYGGLDIVVNNAGYTHVNQPMLNVDEETFDRIYAVNVKGIYLAAVHAVPVFRKQGRGGCIITTASTAGLRPRPGLTWYNGSKGAAITLTKSMAAELGPEKIRVNCICPVAGDTAMLHKFLGGDTPEHRARFIATVPMGRLSKPIDIANAALYLASDEADFITGVALEVDGGRCI